MVESEDRFSDGEAVPKELFGVGQVAAGDRACGEVAEVDGDFVLVGWVAATENGQGSLEECFGLVDAALVEKGHTEHGQVLCDEMVVGSELSLVQSHCPCGQGFGLVWVALGVGESGEVVPQGSGTGMLGSGRGDDEVESFVVDRGCGVVAAGVFVDNAEGVERRRPWGHRIGGGLLCLDGSGNGLGEHPLSLLYSPWKRNRSPSLTSSATHSVPCGATTSKMLTARTSCLSCGVKLSELLMTVGQSVECLAQFEAAGAGATEQRGCPLGVS